MAKTESAEDSDRFRPDKIKKLPDGKNLSKLENEDYNVIIVVKYKLRAAIKEKVLEDTQKKIDRSFK